MVSNMPVACHLVEATADTGADMGAGTLALASASEPRAEPTVTMMPLADSPGDRRRLGRKLPPAMTESLEALALLDASPAHRGKGQKRIPAAKPLWQLSPDAVPTWDGALPGVCQRTSTIFMDVDVIAEHDEEEPASPDQAGSAYYMYLHDGRGLSPAIATGGDDVSYGSGRAHSVTSIGSSVSSLTSLSTGMASPRSSGSFQPAKSAAGRSRRPWLRFLKQLLGMSSANKKRPVN